MPNSEMPHPGTSPASGEDRVIAGGWHQSDIIAGLQKRGVSITVLSRRLGYGRTTLQAALYNRDYLHAHRIIAAALGVTLHELFPDWYGPDNKSIPPPPDHD